MKTFIAFSLVIIILSFSIFIMPVLTYEESCVGVKNGGWIEYSVEITGPDLPPSHNITWFRMEIFNVEDAAFQVNVTDRNVGGSFSSSIWNFNFTDGQLGGWVIIPANLGVGNSFYDSAKSANVTIEGEKQKVVAGATRTITNASDSIRVVKEWDKATGVYTYSEEYPKNFSVISCAVATNMWDPEIMELSPTILSAIIGAVIVLIVLISSSIFGAKRQVIKRPALRSLSQGKIAALTIIAVVLVQIAGMIFYPYYAGSLSFAEFNLIMQTFWTALVVFSMWFRLKGNYFVHELLMLIVIGAWMVGFSAVLLMDPFSSSSMQIFSSTPLRLVMNFLHGIFSIPALIFGTWLVVLWRPELTTFAAKSRKIALLTLAFWIPSYIVGVLDFIILHTTFFG